MHTNQSHVAKTTRPDSGWKHWRTWTLRAACVAVIGAGLTNLPAHGSDIPPFLRDVIVDAKPVSAKAVAEKNLLALDTAMMDVYEISLAKYKKNMRDRVPIILSLFSEGGGRMILYRPGQEPLEAPPVPVIYQITKSVSHSSMAIYQIVAPYLSDPSDASWHGPMEAFRVRCQTAKASIDAAGLAADEAKILHAILDRNIAFMNECLEKKSFTSETLEKFAHDCAPYFGRTIGIAARAQVAHWMGVLDDWKKLIGADWNRTYAVSNSIYVTRQNNILYTVLAQFMGEEAMGSRLLLIETTEFTTTPDKMLDLLARIVSDRGLGMVFFKDYFLMDYELLGGGARKVIEAEATKRGIKPFLPPMAPFYSTDWPWKTNPNKGKGPARLEDVKQ
jgi:hypothetical protein